MLLLLAYLILLYAHLRLFPFVFFYSMLFYAISSFLLLLGASRVVIHPRCHFTLFSHRLSLLFIGKLFYCSRLWLSLWISNRRWVIIASGFGLTSLWMRDRARLFAFELSYFRWLRDFEHILVSLDGNGVNIWNSLSHVKRYAESVRIT